MSGAICAASPFATVIVLAFFLILFLTGPTGWALLVILLPISPVLILATSVGFIISCCFMVCCWRCCKKKKKVKKANVAKRAFMRKRAAVDSGASN